MRQIINQCRWLRVIGDTIFALGCMVFVWFVFGLSTGHSFGPETAPTDEPLPDRPSAYSPVRT